MPNRRLPPGRALQRSVAARVSFCASLADVPAHPVWYACAQAVLEFDSSGPFTLAATATASKGKQPLLLTQPGTPQNTAHILDRDAIDAHVLLLVCANRQEEARSGDVGRLHGAQAEGQERREVSPCFSKQSLLPCPWWQLPRLVSVLNPWVLISCLLDCAQPSRRAAAAAVHLCQTEPGHPIRAR